MAIRYVPPSGAHLKIPIRHILICKTLGSPIRLERIQKLASEIDAGPKPPNADLLRRQIFSDRFNAPQAICCQEDPARPIETRSSTLFCIIMNLAEATEPSAEVVWGKPGSGEEGPVLSMPW